MKKMRNLLCVLLCTVFLLSACAQGTGGSPEESAGPEVSQTAQEPAKSQGPAESQQPEESQIKWIPSDIAGTVTAETDVDVRDDFHVAVNKDWLALENPNNVAQNSFTERGEEVRNEIMALIADETQTSHEAKLVQKLYYDYVDMDVRNQRGMDPVMPLVERIQEIDSIDDLTAYLTSDEDKLSSQPFSIEILSDWKDSTQNAVYISSQKFSLSDADEYRQMTEVGKRTKAATEVFFQKMLVKAGYTEEEAARLSDKLYELEGKVGAVSVGEAEAQSEGFRERAYHPVTIEEMEELSPNFPMGAFLKSYTDAGIDRFILLESEWLKEMNNIYTEENLEGFKAWLLYDTFRIAATILDQECLDIYMEYNGNMLAGGKAINLPIEELAFNQCSSMLYMAVGKMYAENYVTPETKQTVEKMVEDVVNVYRKRLENNDWLSSETKKKAIEKLDNLKVHVAYPDDWSPYDYSGIQFPEDGGIFEDVLTLQGMSLTQNVKKAASPVNTDIWTKAPQEVNAFYRPNDNSMNIPAGILGGAFYDPEASYEEQLGSIGMVIGHEITHGFDSTGSTFDKDGNVLNWWTEEDRAAFIARTDKVAAYFNEIEVLPGTYVDGNRTIGETVADLGGMSCMLEIAKTKEDFDYKAFFTSYASIWKEKEPQEMLEYRMQTDPHAPGFLRTNVTVQQFQEFYDAFGIEEGDGMYLAPEERLSVW